MLQSVEGLSLQPMCFGNLEVQLLKPHESWYHRYVHSLKAKHAMGKKDWKNQYWRLTVNMLREIEVVFVITLTATIFEAILSLWYMSLSNLSYGYCKQNLERQLVFFDGSNFFIKQQKRWTSFESIDVLWVFFFKLNLVKYNDFQILIERFLLMFVMLILSIGSQNQSCCSD